MMIRAFCLWKDYFNLVFEGLWVMRRSGGLVVSIPSLNVTPVMTLGEIVKAA